MSTWGAVAGLTCCEGYLINVDSFCSAAEVKAGGAEEHAASKAEPQQPAAAPLQPRAVLPRPNGLKRKGAPLHALPRQQHAPAVAPVSIQSAASAVRPATRSGPVLAIIFLGSNMSLIPSTRLTVGTCLVADEEILRLLLGRAPAHAAAQPVLLPPPLDPEPVQNAADTEAAASAGADLQTGASAGGKALARWATFAPPAEAQPHAGAAAQPAGACIAPAEPAAAGQCGRHASGQVACQVSGPEREHEAGGASGAGSRALVLPPVPRRRPLHDVAVVHAALGSARATAAGRGPAQDAGCLAAGLRFPGAAEAAAAVRCVRVPDAFGGGAEQYERVFAAALVEELNLRLVSLCRRCNSPPVQCAKFALSTV